MGFSIFYPLFIIERRKEKEQLGRSVGWIMVAVKLRDQLLLGGILRSLVLKEKDSPTVDLNYGPVYLAQRIPSSFITYFPQISIISSSRNHYLFS